MRTPSGIVISQSVAIARFLAGLGNLLPQNGEDAALADSVVDGISDLMSSAVAAHYAPADLKEQKIKEFNATIVPKFFSFFENFLAKGGGKFFAGNSFSWADLAICCAMDIFAPAVADMDQYPLLKAHKIATLERPRIKEYLASERRIKQTTS